MNIRKQYKHGLVTIHRDDDELWLEISGATNGYSDGLYHWDGEAGSGFPGAIKHGGNFLLGNEYRRSVSTGGDWVQYPHLEHGHVVSTRGLGYGSNGYPNLSDIEAVLRGENTNGWEMTDPRGGHNDEWIPMI